MKSLYEGKKPPSAKVNMELAYKLRDGDLEARKQMIEGNAGFAYKRAIKYASMNSGWSHIDSDDILQSAMMGLVEAVDRFDPDKGYAFTTYAHWWIVKRISEEISMTHWNTMRPPRNMMRDFLYKKMTGGEAGEYITKFMSGGIDAEHGSHAQFNSHVDDDAHALAEIAIAVDRSGLTKIEIRVFNSLYGENIEQDKLDDLTKTEINDIEESLLEKLRGQFD